MSSEPHQTTHSPELLSASPAARKRLGIVFLSVVIVLWVSSSFLTYAIFSDDSYSKPYFCTYFNTCVFCLYLLPWAFGALRERRRAGADAEGYIPVSGNDDGMTTARSSDSYGLAERGVEGKEVEEGLGKLGTRETMKLSAEFCLLWFFANYTGSSCLQWTSVASATILSSTSSVFTLILGSLLRVEVFTWTKFLAVMISLVGVSLISRVDLDSTSPSEMDVSDPTHRKISHILIGDGIALMGALAYGVYTTLLKVRIGHESRISMQMFFGFVGLFNLIGLWPGLVILHYSGVEKFELPPDERVWWIVGINGLIALISDYCWAYAMLLTTPVVVTVGLSLTIPLALLGQIIILGKTSNVVYWLGAALVFVAFLFVNRESEELHQSGVAGSSSSSSSSSPAAAAAAAAAASRVGDDSLREHLHRTGEEGGRELI